MRANPERRRKIADAAVQVLARLGGHGLSHRAVDAEAGLPRGTTSNFFNSRQAILLAAAEQLSDRHWEYVQTLKDHLDGPLDRERLATLLQRLVAGEDKDARVRLIARYELFLASVREPELQPAVMRIRAAALETATALLDAAGLPEPKARVGLLMATLTGLTFDHLTAPPRLRPDSEPVATTTQVLDTIFGL
jgi:DNA-binding transcriptional regulator YbjK